MALIVLCEPKYTQTAECDTKRRGITDEAARRRINQPQIFTDPRAAKEFALQCAEDLSVILLFDSLHWLQEAVAELSECRVHIILSANHVDIPLPISYSQVGTDMDAAMCTAVDYLHSCGKHRIALVGANPDSCNDRACVAMLQKYVPDEDHCIFYAEDDLSDCFDAFAAVQDRFDAAVCTNALPAICLSEHLHIHPRAEEKPFILSLTDTAMSEFYRDGITSMTANFYDCGRKLAEAHFHRLKYGFSRSVYLLPAELKVRESTDNTAYVPSAKLPAPTQQIPLSPKKTDCLSTGNIGSLDRILAASDLTNLRIIYCLLCDFDYTQMHKFCFISADTARSRVRKIRDTLGVETKPAAVDILCTYIKKESLLKIIREQEEQG